MRLRALLAVSLISTVAPVAFAGGPSAEHIKSAAAEYDAGRRAFTDGKFEEAAIHFENAYHDAPAAQALRFAIRARKQANQLARAATLAIIAQQNYADDEPTQQAVKEVLAEATPKLFKLSVSCDVDCAVAADGRAVSVEDAKRFSVFLQPGPHNVVVSWPGDRTKSLDVKAREGQALEQSFVAPPMPVVQNPNNGNGNIGGGATLTEQPSNKPFGPAVFVTLAALTAISGGILIWSGVDTLNNPGADFVKANCVGQGEQCPSYQTGLASQTRTNVLIGVTGGLGLLTFVSIFLTQWSHPQKEGVKVEATVGLGTVGLAGRF
ncbi:MAG TPA: hypothetical protein VH054_04145 [Polyangiaceae bacterium]|jgi:hypothetical protein|nr:hypothetical protein [Polyangiaceae bacterium]